MSKQPHKQRTRTERAPLHERHRQVHATLSGDLRDEYGTRSARVNTGDTVEVMRGDFAGEEGEVTSVDLRSATVDVEDVTAETADGEDVPRSLEASNLRIIDLNLDDSRREDRLEADDE